MIDGDDSVQVKFECKEVDPAKTAELYTFRLITPAIREWNAVTNQMYNSELSITCEISTALRTCDPHSYLSGSGIRGTTRLLSSCCVIHANQHTINLLMSSYRRYDI